MQSNKIWLDRGSDFYNRSIESWLEQNATEMYSTHNEGKYVVAERFIRNLKNKIYKYITSISKNMYIDKLDDIVEKYSNTYHNIMKMKPVDVKLNKYISLIKKLIIKILNLKLVILLEYKNIKIFLQKVILQNGLKKFLWLWFKKLKIMCCGQMLLIILTRKR